MKKKSSYILIVILLSICLSVKASNVYEIKEDIGNKKYKKVSFESDEKTVNHYFKFDVKDTPKSRIGAFRIDFDVFNELSLEKNEVYCTFVEKSKSDDDLVKELEGMNSKNTNCIGQFNKKGIFEGIIKYDKDKTKLGIILKAKGEIKFTATVYVQTKEQILETKEQKMEIDEIYSLVPFTVNIPDFREKTGQILLYSYNKELQMYYVENDTPYPKAFFSGNIMSIYTDKNMVHQKYHDAEIMALLPKGFSREEDISSEFEVIFPNDYLLDYYVSNNPNGRSKNSPLAINMTECKNPYYFILNYNKPEKKTSLFIDQIYGKIKSLSVATEFSSNTWNDMINKDMEKIQIDRRSFVLLESNIHMDIYKLECEVPLLLNFYYVDESAEIPDLDYGQVVITTLKPHQLISFPFTSGISDPKLSIEIFNPIKLPFVNLNDGENEMIIKQNYIFEYNSSSTENPIIIKEIGGESDTRIIIKVGYNLDKSWDKKPNNVYYNSDLKMYVFSFPNDEKKLNYTYVDLTTKGVNEGDNVKYCYGTNIGSAIIPSAENCYRVSKDNEYILKFLNPFVMHKEYEIEDKLVYYISIKPVVSTEQKEVMEVIPKLYEYDVKERNFEEVGKNIKIDSSGKASTILTPPKFHQDSIFVQIQNCNLEPISVSFSNAYNKDSILNKKEISKGKNFFEKFENTFFETELHIEGPKDNNVFVKHVGTYDFIDLKFKEEPLNITYNSDLSQIEIERPTDKFEEMNYTVFIAKSGELKNKGFTLCSFAEKQQISQYNKTVRSYNEIVPININFKKFDLKVGDTFEVLVYIEQLSNFQMEFLSEVFTFTVGEIKTDVVIPINKIYEKDTNYVYAEGRVEKDQKSYYYSYLPESISDVPVGTFSIELDSEKEYVFSRVECAFVDEDEDEKSMIDAIQDVVDSYNSYCTGGKSVIDGKTYNYIFRYTYKGDKPRRLVIKLFNDYAKSDSDFTIYIRKGENTFITPTNFEEEKEYGEQDENKKSIMPYIVDLEQIRGNSETDYISKILIYSKYFEMQMYILDETLKTNAPLKIFSGNIMLLYTKLDLAKEKYRSTKLILLCEDLFGQKETPQGTTFRFHTKMFKSDFPIEYYLYNNPVGLYYSYPLSFQINTCSETNNKAYYIINYNKALQEVTLYLDILYGSTKKVRIDNNLDAEKWGTLLDSGMVEVDNFEISLADKTTHVDIIEIECNTPLLANVYYHYDNFGYYYLRNGNFVIKSLQPQESKSFTIDISQFRLFYYSISLFNPTENPNIRVTYKDMGEKIYNENALFSGYLVNAPEEVTIINDGDSPTRFIYKIGYGVESEWTDEKKKIDGKLYSKNDKFVYKFPIGNNKKNFTSVSIDVKSMKTETPEESNNVKFCFSTSMGIPIDISYENCFRAGDNMPYTLTFLNPLIFPKTYTSYSNDYYITLGPYYVGYDYISLEIKENKYEIEERNIEGVSKVLNLKNKEISTILSLPEMALNTDQILLQMQLCSSSVDSINYEIKNSYTNEEILKSELEKRKMVIKNINNTLYENELKFISDKNAEIFTKHIGLIDDEFELLEGYKATLDEKENTVLIDRPISNENFNITILVGKDGKLKDYTLCTFAGKSESQYKGLADYVKTFQTKTDIDISHYIDFLSFGYKEGDEFDLLVYAVQIGNSKLEFLYDVISDKVKSINKDVIEIKEKIVDDNHVQQSFSKDDTSNYLLYNFKESPNGNIASFRIKQEEGEEGEEKVKISQVGCIFVDTNTNKADMISLVTKAIEEGTSSCVGGYNKDTQEYNGLINTIDIKNDKKRLVLKIIYDLSEDKNLLNQQLRSTVPSLVINLRINGYKVDNPNSHYNEDENLALVPYVLDLNEIRGDNKEDYISKVLLFSKNHEMNIFYLDNGAPVELFYGNILVIYTNPDLIKEKYNGATTMILLTETFSERKEIAEEEDKFKVYLFKSEDTIQYFLSGNPTGRLLNKPTSIEMNSCVRPYLYILNYHSYEGKRILHLENVFGEINSTKIATEINYNDWDDFIKNLKPFNGNEYNIEEQNKYHFDVLEVTCNTPLLLNVYYTDPSAPKKENLDKDDITILSLKPGDTEVLTFKPEIEGDFIYTFNVLKTNDLSPKMPNIVISFNQDEYIHIIKYGIYTKKSKDNYPSINIENVDETNGNDETKVLFKFGYGIDKTFTKIENDIYHLETENRQENLYAYIFKNGEDRLNYTSVDFTVSTEEENVKFCYGTNFGSFIIPSLQNCYRVGKSNPYTISILNPYIMHKDYYTSEENMDFYVSFKTINNDQNIKITPHYEEYKIKRRILEGYPNTIEILESEEKTLLTKPANNEKYLVTQMEICTPNTSVEYEFYNAFDNTNLGQSGKIEENSKNNLKIIENAYLDTLLVLKNVNGNKETPEVFIKHAGINENYQPKINDIKISSEKKGKKIIFNKPISGEEFNYTIYIDRKDYLSKQNYNLCNYTKLTKLAHYSQNFNSNEEKIEIDLDFEYSKLKGYKKYDVLILADNGKLMIFSEVFSGEVEDDDDGKSNLALILCIVIALVVILIIVAILFIRQYKKKKNNIEELMNEDKELVLPMKEM